MTVTEIESAIRELQNSGLVKNEDVTVRIEWQELASMNDQAAGRIVLTIPNNT